MGREAKPADVVTREYTINLGKAITGITFKKRAPRAVAAVRVAMRLRCGVTLDAIATPASARARRREMRRDAMRGMAMGGLFEPVCAVFAAVDGREALGVTRKTSDD